MRLLALLLVPAFMVLAACLPRRYRDNWLVGENVGHPHQDNGHCFFRYCVAQGYRHVFFVAGSDAVDKDSFLRDSERVLAYGSVSHFLMVSLSSTFLYTHTQRDIIYRSLLPLVMRGKKRVFLDHGVTAFKKFHPDYQKARNDMDIFVVVSKFEQLIATERIGTDPHRVRITGFPRFDYLVDRSSRGTDTELLYFPTWRDWITPDQANESAFFRGVRTLLLDARLHDMLQAHRLVLNVCPHTRLHIQLKTLSIPCSRIRFIEFGEESVQDLVCKCRLLITDYSSVSWDFFYLKKPVLFYQFDLDDYLKERGAYIDLRASPFGERAETRDDLLRLMANCINRGFAITEEDSRKVDELFEFRDKENSRRLYRAIRELQAEK